MTDAATEVSPAMIEFLSWVAARQRSYAEAMDAWGTSCPRSSVWEDATIAGYVVLQRCDTETVVRLSHLGQTILDAG